MSDETVSSIDMSFSSVTSSLCPHSSSSFMLKHRCFSHWLRYLSDLKHLNSIAYHHNLNIHFSRYFHNYQFKYFLSSSHIITRHRSRSRIAKTYFNLWRGACRLSIFSNTSSVCHCYFLWKQSTYSSFDDVKLLLFLDMKDSDSLTNCFHHWKNCHLFLLQMKLINKLAQSRDLKLKLNHFKKLQNCHNYSVELNRKLITLFNSKLLDLFNYWISAYKLSLIGGYCGNFTKKSIMLSYFLNWINCCNLLVNSSNTALNVFNSKIKFKYLKLIRTNTELSQKMIFLEQELRIKKLKTLFVDWKAACLTNQSINLIKYSYFRQLSKWRSLTSLTCSNFRQISTKRTFFESWKSNYLFLISLDVLSQLSVKDRLEKTNSIVLSNYFIYWKDKHSNLVKFSLLSFFFEQWKNGLNLSIWYYNRSVIADLFFKQKFFFKMFIPSRLAEKYATMVELVNFNILKSFLFKLEENVFYQI
ncbi:hypothetical protein P9112_003357 [Eukaryota sp. TZLM1-RC]